MHDGNVDLDGSAEIGPLRPGDQQIAQMRDRHSAVLQVCCAVVVLSILLEVDHSATVSVTGFPEIPLPQLCSSQAMFGVRCPGCGLTRSFIHLAHGRLAESWSCHRIGAVLALVVVLNIPYRILALRRKPVDGLTSRWPDWIGSTLIALLVGNWFIEQVISAILNA